MIHVLLVDDDPDILDLQGGLLRAEGFGVDTASNAEEALRKLESYHPELIIADVQMPGMNGFDLCRELRDTGRDDIPFFFCSTRGSLPERVEGLRLGADDYLVKPVDPDELRFRVRAQIEKNRSLREMRAKAIEEGKQVLSGRLQEVDLAQVLQLLEQGKESGCFVVAIRTDLGEARIWIETRRVIHAEIGDFSGEKALFRIIQIEEGTFEVVPSTPPEVRTLDETVSGVLLDVISQLDEFNLLLQAFSESGTYLFVKYSDDLFSTRFSPAMLETLALVEQHHDLQAVLDENPLTDLATIRVVIELMQIGFVGAKPRPQQYQRR